MARIIVVDDADTVIGYKDRNDRNPADIYRVSSLWITDKKGDHVLLAKRALSKDHDPGKWGPAVSGTVEEGETYDSNIIKGAEEELGLTNIKPVQGPKEKYSGQYKFFGQWYLLTLNKPVDDLVINKEEVEEVKWFSTEELTKALFAHPESFLPALSRWKETFAKEGYKTSFLNLFSK